MSEKQCEQCMMYSPLGVVVGEVLSGDEALGLYFMLIGSPTLALPLWGRGISRGEGNA